METLTDRIILLISCVIILILQPITITSVVVFLIAVSVSALNLVYEQSQIRKVICIIYVLLCVIEPLFSVFIPLILYDTFWHKEYVISSLLTVMLLRYLIDAEQVSILLLVLFTVLSYLLVRKTIRDTALNKEYKKLRDTSKELSLLLENKNRDLIEKQDYEIHLATLKERNRIATIMWGIFYLDQF